MTPYTLIISFLSREREITTIEKSEGEGLQNSDQASNAIRGRNVGYNEETRTTDCGERDENARWEKRSAVIPAILYDGIHQRRRRVNVEQPVSTRLASSHTQIWADTIHLSHRRRQSEQMLHHFTKALATRAWRQHEQQWLTSSGNGRGRCWKPPSMLSPAVLNLCRGRHSIACEGLHVVSTIPLPSGWRCRWWVQDDLVETGVDDQANGDDLGRYIFESAGGLWVFGLQCLFCTRTIWC